MLYKTKAVQRPYPEPGPAYDLLSLDGSHNGKSGILGIVPVVAENEVFSFTQGHLFYDGRHTGQRLPGTEEGISRTSEQITELSLVAALFISAGVQVSLAKLGAGFWSAPGLMIETRVCILCHSLR